ncbi:mechanosensitive ion channel domain-containing protein [Pantoea sp. S18]|uniref:mechanosensitive ion channel domain-containing protein n=1 Tax=Pantoea sp. S18 TaxID=3019892 RepID=UPI0012AE7FAD|nr:mechanosensitive ion channel domain-containing protein [Pantoea sp. S18]MEA5101389.1 mechanosensitive ion channel [Pantoea sp. S18]MRT44098.1 mechanosensitive ion channel [Enterobacteriaceae bacterium RIT702]
MIKAVMCLCGFLLLLTFQNALGAEPRQAPSAQEKARTLYLLNQPVVMLQAKFGLTTPEERVQRIVSILRTLDDNDLAQPVKMHTLTRYQQSAVLFSVNGKPFMLLAQGDLDEGDDLTLEQAAERLRFRLDTLRQSLSEQYSSRYLLLSVGKSLVGALLLIAFILFALRSYAWLKRIYDARRAQRKSFPGALRTFLGPIEVRLYAIVLTVAFLVAFYIWVSWVLRLFPWTRIWGMELGRYAVGLLQHLGLAIFSALPGMLIVVVIFLITGLVTRLLRLVLKRVETGQLHLPGLHPDTVGVTRKLISVVIWLFALSAAYPFLPGANSLAFKGISVFFGLMLTLGSAGVMNHAMSGLVLTYSRALRKGEVIRIAEHEGVVSEVGMLATKILTRENYEVTVPNAVVVSGRIVNLSATLKGDGVNMTTSVTIGYDTPWRQVEAMLELAASRTQGVNRSITPVVRQLALQDWYVAYELQVRLQAGESLAGVRSILHGHIQDVFNEFGVQIMSPNFISQPDQPVIVTKSNWFSPPANKDVRDEG